MSTPFSTADFGPQTHDNSDVQKIADKQWVPCRICEGAFGRLRLTRRYCDTCKRGACEGEHLNFAAQNKKGRCTSCGDKVLGHI
jgi:hypothetical protein